MTPPNGVGPGAQATAPEEEQSPLERFEYLNQGLARATLDGRCDTV